ncbi:MAG: chorismate transformation enzyme, FkbO/Hyg5 family [Panacagrimonas sp.]
MPSTDRSCVWLDTRAAANLAPLACFPFGEVVPLTPLRPAQAEAWFGSAPPRRGSRDVIAYAEDGTWLMSELRVDASASEDIEQAAFDAYRCLAAFNAASGYPHLLRVWNYFDRLNIGAGDDERYRRFCIGRYRAIAQPGFESNLPAATVIGSDQPGLVLSFLAAREPGIQIENPRQTSAFRYPRDYGPIAPSFSRATLVGRHLLVSGTAAVVGHVTLHPNDALTQVDEIVANLEALLDRAAQPASGTWAAQALRLYLRNPADTDAVLARFAERLGSTAPIAVLRGDISRSDLMVEVEGVWTLETGHPL